MRHSCPSEHTSYIPLWEASRSSVVSEERLTLSIIPTPLTPLPLISHFLPTPDIDPRRFGAQSSCTLGRIFCVLQSSHSFLFRSSGTSITSPIINQPACLRKYRAVRAANTGGMPVRDGRYSCTRFFQVFLVLRKENQNPSYSFRVELKKSNLQSTA